ncbi:MAG: hypothetical protein Q4D57_00910 [Clostridia bacterium]|nr:hypothetical protein [Clostridia bacterium]
MIDKFLSFLGIAKKSGNLIFGMDEVKSKIISGDICLVMIVSDISSNSLEKIESFMAEKAGTINLIKLSYTKDDMERITSKYAAVIGVSDINIANKIKLLAEENPKQKTERNDAYNDKI